MKYNLFKHVYKICKTKVSNCCCRRNALNFPQKRMEKQLYHSIVQNNEALRFSRIEKIQRDKWEEFDISRHSSTDDCFKLWKTFSSEKHADSKAKLDILSFLSVKSKPLKQPRLLCTKP